MLLAVLGISAVSADSGVLSKHGITPYSQDTIVSVDGMNFNIPAGFGEDTSSAENLKNDGNGLITSTKGYLNDKGEIISITVEHGKTVKSIDEFMTGKSGATKKTINGHQGVLIKNNKTVTFMYLQDGRSVGITGIDDSLFDKVIQK